MRDDEHLVGGRVELQSKLQRFAVGVADSNPRHPGPGRADTVAWCPQAREDDRCVWKEFLAAIQCEMEGPVRHRYHQVDSSAPILRADVFAQRLRRDLRREPLAFQELSEILYRDVGARRKRLAKRLLRDRVCRELFLAEI